MRNRYIGMIFILAAVLASTPAASQTSSLDEPGIPSFTTAFPVEHGFINLANGALHIEIPIGSYSQRGNVKALNARLVYDSRFWIVRTDPVSERQYWAPDGLPPVGIRVGGFRLITDLEPGFANESSSVAQCGCISEGSTCHPIFKTTYTGFFYQEPNGTMHRASDKFKLVQSSCVAGSPGNATVGTVDNSGLKLVITNYTISAVYGADGTQVFPSVQDTNGNFFSQDSNGNVIDTLGRTPVVATRSGSQQFLDYLCEQGCNPGGSDRARTTTNLVPLTLTTNFNQGPVGGQGAVGEYTGPPSEAIQSLVLPDGSTYSFTYDSYGMMTSMTLPTGGQISYGYTNIADYQGNINRWVTSRTVDGQTWSFNPAQLPCSAAPCPMQVTVTTPSYSDGVTTTSDDRVYTFQVVNQGTASGAWNTQIQYFRGRASGNPMVTKNIDYGIVGPTGNIVPGILGGVSVPIRETLIWPTASGTLSKKVEYGYDGYTNVTAVKQWDYQPGGNFASTPDRETDNVFKTDSAYLNANMLRLKTSTTIKNYSGAQVAQTTFGYDENPLQSSGIATHLNAPSGPRGNLTSVNRWLGPNNIFLTIATKWFDTGEAYQSIDPLGNATTFTYDAAFAGAYPTKICNALNQCSYTGYDFNTGLNTSFTDVNGSSAGDQAHTTTRTYDAILRPLCTTAPDGGQTCLSYPNVTTVQKTIKVTSAINNVSSATVDGLGRVIQAQHVMAGGTSKVDTTYDPFGRVNTVSNPYFSSSDSTYGITQYQYDALGRATQTTKQDGSATRLSYSANCATATDETGKPRKTCTNGFGELIEVDEPNAASTGTNATASVVVTGNLLTNGSVIDSGTVSLTSGGFTATACYGSSTSSFCNNKPVNSTAAQVASTLASAFNVFGSPINTTASGSTLSLVWNTPGPFYPSVLALSTVHDQPGLFANPSFASAGTMFDGGTGPSLSANPYVTLYQYDALSNLLCVEQHGGVSGTGCSADASLDNSSPWRVRRFTYDSHSRLLTAKNPESGTITYFYDNNGNLTQKVMPSPNQTGTAQHTIAYCYDSLDRVTGKAYSWQNCQNGQLPSGTAAVTYTYDERANGIGHLTSLTDQAGSATYNYDTIGRMSSESRAINGVTKNMSYTYNLDGSIATVTYPSATPNGPVGDVITYTSDAAGHTLSVKDIGNNINYVTGATYNAPGMLTGSTYGQRASFTGIVNQFGFNVRLQPVNLWSSSPTKTLMGLSYDYQAWIGDNGNVTQIINNRDQSRNQIFTYDPLNRLTSAQNAGTDCSVTLLNGQTKFWGNNYVYDAWGNLMQKQVTKCQAENLNTAVNTFNRLQSFDYDSAGNMTKDNNGTLFSYDPENRISSNSDGFSYAYDAGGNRVQKINGNTTPATGTLYWSMSSGIVGESDLLGNLQSEYILFDGERVARRDFLGGTTSISYYFSDHLKTASVVTDSAGMITTESDYYPWGGELQIVNNDSNHYKFTGKERDAESGLDYFGARYYSNGLGRFVTSDWSAKAVAVPYADFSDPQSLNLYTYVRNIPTTRYDADGHCADDGGKHGWLWCAAHAVGLVSSEQEKKDALHQRAVQARTVISGMTGLTIEGQTPQQWVQGKTDQQLVDEQRRIAEFLLSKVDLICPSSAEGVHCGVAFPAGGIGSAAGEEGAASEFVNITRGASIRNIQTNVTASEFGANLEANGFVKSTAADGTPTYTKGTTQYTVYSQSRSTGGATAQVKVNGIVVEKIRLK